MSRNSHDAYLESRILSAEPVELIRLMYQGCTLAVRDARHYLASGEIAERSKSVSKACAILLELASSLDYERGGDVTGKLARLYEYLQRRLIEANFRKSDEPMAEVLGLLVTLTEAWDGVKAQLEPSVPVENPWMPVPQEAAMGTSNAWSF